MIELLPLPPLTKTRNLDALNNSNAQNRADRKNRKQEARHKKLEARTDERPVSGSDTAAQCSLMRDGSLALAQTTQAGNGTIMDRSFWRTGSGRANLMAMELI